MSLRDDLQQVLHCCAPKGMQHATNETQPATVYATTNATHPTQASNSAALGGTGHATAQQQRAKSHATQAALTQLVARVCRAYECTDGEIEEAINIALADFEAAEVTYRALARNLGIPMEHQLIQMKGKS